MSPRCFQQLPFSTFSLTFFLFWQGLLSLNNSSVGGEPGRVVASAFTGRSMASSSSSHGISWLLRHRKSSVAKPKFVLWLHYSTSQQCKSPSLCAELGWRWGGGWRRGEQACRGWRLFPQKLKQPFETGDFQHAHPQPREGRGVSSGSAFHSSVCAPLVLLSLVFLCCCSFSSLWFLFLDVSVGACSFYIKQRKPVGILKLGAFSTTAGCIFFRSRREVSIGW